MPASPDLSRRRTLKGVAWLSAWLAGAGALPQTAQAYEKAAFDASAYRDALRTLGVGALIESRDVLLDAPEVAENGAVVPLAVSTSLAGVKRLLVLVEKNPAPLAAIFHVTEAVEPQVSLRVKMSESSHVYAVAWMTDGRALYARKEVSITLGGCG
jgi:sulfur-oxidizing protein SoxY